MTSGANALQVLYGAPYLSGEFIGKRCLACLRFIHTPSFKIEDTLYGVNRCWLGCSTFFSELLSDGRTGSLGGRPVRPTSDSPRWNNHVRDGQLLDSSERQVGILRFKRDYVRDADARVLLRRVEECLVLTIEQWSAALHLATMWDLEDLRKYVIEHINAHFPNQHPLDRIDLAFMCHVDGWIHLAYVTPCASQ